MPAAIDHGCIHGPDYSIMKRLMHRELLITHASQLITVAGPARPRIRTEMAELAAIEDGAVLIRDGFIIAAGTSSEILALGAGEDARVIDASGSVVMPGYVDAHTHPVFAGTREDEYCLRAAGLTYQE